MKALADTFNDTRVQRSTVLVDGIPTSYVTVEQRGPVVLMLHGTYWSRVWLPVLEGMAAAGLRPIAVDFPGLGRSAGELTVETATVPALAEWVTRLTAALQITGTIGLAGHDIGGAVAQHLLVHEQLDVSRLALMNSVLYDSWPAPRVAEFADPAAETTIDDILAARREGIRSVLAGAATEQLIAEYLDPWTVERVCRSWLAMAAAADSRYTLELMPALRRSPVPKLLVWGEDDPDERIGFAQRYVDEVPHAALVPIPHADHIPSEIAPGRIARALAGFFGGAER